MKLYKWLNDENKPAHGGSGEWGLPKNGKPGKWFKVTGELEPYWNGLHLCREQDLLTWIAQDLYEGEHKGKLVEADNKVVVRQARLTKALDGWNEQGARLFACDCAERVLEAVGSPDPRSVKAVWVSRAYAFGLVDDAALDAARAAAWAAERKWQTNRLLEYARGEVDLDEIKARTEKWLEDNSEESEGER